MKTAPDKWGTPIARDTSGVEILREIRGVRLFDQMPTMTRWIYGDIARCFPGIQVWAVGSRVRGGLRVGNGREMDKGSAAKGWNEKQG